MLNERTSRTDNKAIRRKINQKMQTLIKRALDLTQNSCQVLLIIQYTAKNHWVQYCSSDSSSLFFGFQEAQKYLDRTESYNNNNIDKFVPNFPAEEDSTSPQPTKHFKTQDQSVNSSQTINIAGKLEDLTKMSQSALSTDLASNKSFNINPPKMTKPPDVNLTNPLVKKNTQGKEDSSSPEFSFEDYFGQNES